MLKLLDLAALSDRYVIIGGAAVHVYDASRTINDIDILLQDEAAIARLRPHLAKTGFSTKRFSRSAPILTHECGKVDVLPAELDPIWERAWQQRVPGVIFGIAVLVPPVDALVALKQSAVEDPAQVRKSEDDLRRLAVIRASRRKGRRVP